MEKSQTRKDKLNRRTPFYEFLCKVALIIFNLSKNLTRKYTDVCMAVSQITQKSFSSPLLSRAFYSTKP